MTLWDAEQEAKAALTGVIKDVFLTYNQGRNSLRHAEMDTLTRRLHDALTTPGQRFLFAEGGVVYHVVETELDEVPDHGYVFKVTVRNGRHSDE